ncbi:hypothetical protein T265_10071 [Opisthorchis viverrini]|uniref:Uncharacterized protein n=1 Tax=Opisthorchis viverrini TaxID=6198 RepID=A0A074Z3M8_OPIVI|nr:hypothetical protein T265_10071 [Opisthorchis viverrini]KER21651.1 hypothetical protein T265_10071 [Opisthorchis viverrini]
MSTDERGYFRATRPMELIPVSEIEYERKPKLYLPLTTATPPFVATISVLTNAKKCAQSTSSSDPHVCGNAAEEI